MTLNAMREFIRLAANKNYTKTAEELFITQSGLSKHISAIEDEMQTKLINRTRNTFELTSEGEMVLTDFKAIIDIYDSLINKLSETDADEDVQTRL